MKTPRERTDDSRFDLSKREVQQRLTPVATRGLLKIAKAWDLSAEDARLLLGGMSTGSFYKAP